MKRIISVGAAGVALASLCGLAAAQGFLRGNPPFPALAQAGKPAFNIRVFPPGARFQPPRVLPMIPPGVYKAEPYSCIVVVPGAHLDDRCIINPGGRDIPMPIVKPDLHFIPWNAAK